MDARCHHRLSQNSPRLIFIFRLFIIICKKTTTFFHLRCSWSALCRSLFHQQARGWRQNCGVWCLSCDVFQSCGKTSDFSVNDTIISMLNTYLMHPLWPEEWEENVSLITQQKHFHYARTGVKPLYEAAHPSGFFRRKQKRLPWSFGPGESPLLNSFGDTAAAYCALRKLAKPFKKLNWHEVTRFHHQQKRRITNSMYFNIILITPYVYS